MSNWLSPRKPAFTAGTSPGAHPMTANFGSLSPSPSSLPLPPFARFQNAVAHLPSLPAETAPTYMIPTSRILPDDVGTSGSSGSTRAIDPEHASSAAFDPTTSLLLRNLGTGHVLELRSLQFAYEQDNAPTTKQSVLRLRFPEPLRDLSGGEPIYVDPETEEVIISLLDEKNYLFRLTLPSLTKFRAEHDGTTFQYDPRVGMVKEYQVDENRFEGLGIAQGGKLVWTSAGRDAVAVGIREGVLLMRIVGEDIHYTTLRQTSYLPLFTLNPFSRPRLSTQIISLQAVPVPRSSPGFASSTLIFAYSMDLKLRVFSGDVGGGQGLLGIVDIVAGRTGSAGEGEGSRAGSVVVESRAGNLMPSTPGRGRFASREPSGTPFSAVAINGAAASIGSADDLSSTLLHVYLSPHSLPVGSSAFYAITFTPTPSSISSGYFTISKCSIRNRAIEFRCLGRIAAAESTAGAELRGFHCEQVEAVKMAGTGEGEEQVSGPAWRLWACYDVAGKAVIQEVEVTGTMLGKALDAEEDDGIRWQTSFDIDADLRPALDAPYFEHLLEQNWNERRSAYKIKGLFLDELFYPGRFSVRTIESATEEYIRVNILERVAEDEVPDDVKYTYNTLRERLETVLGCHLGSFARHISDPAQRMKEIETEEERQLLVRECQGFWSSVVDANRQASWPVGLFPLSTRSDSGVLVTGRDCLVVPTVQDEISLLYSLRSDEGGAAVRYASADQLDKHYPMLANPTRRADILVLVNTAHSLTNWMGYQGVEAFAEEMLSVAKSPTCGPITGLIAAHHSLLLDHPMPEDIISSLEATFPAGHPMSLGVWNSLLDKLISYGIHPGWKQTSRDTKTTFIGMSLSLSTLHQVVCARTSFISSLLPLLGYMVSRPLEDVGAMEGVIGRAVAGLSQLDVLKLVVELSAEEAKTLVGGALANSRERAVSHFELGSSGEHHRSPPSESCFSLVYAACGDVAVGAAESAMMPAALPTIASVIAYSSALLPDQVIFTATPLNAKFALTLLRLNCNLQAEEFISKFSPNVALEYLRGRAILAGLEGAMDGTRWAATAFDAVAGTLSHAEWQTVDESGLDLILPEIVLREGLPRYHLHIADIFERMNDTPLMLKYAELAYDAMLDREVEIQVRDSLLMRIFRAQLKLGRYHAAYDTMMRVQSSERAPGSERPLATFINAMCGAGLFEQLLSMPFTGVEVDVERELDFKATNSAADSDISYAKILHAWYVRKSDYLGAGKAMYLYGRRSGRGLSSRRSADVQAALGEQARAYMTAVHSLEMIPEEDAWFALPMSQKLTRGRAVKRQKLSHFVSPDFSSKSRSGAFEVITLSDIRKEYAIILGTLHLLTDAEQELTDVEFTANDCVEALVWQGMYERAFCLAKAIDASMDPIFSSLTEMCLELTGLEQSGEVLALRLRGDWLTQSQLASTWRGSISQKAWRFLQIHLEQHDGASNGHAYQSLVLETTASAHGIPLPPWLVARCVAYDADGLLRVALRYKRTEDAKRWAQERTRKPLLSAISATRRPFTYGTLDQVVAAAGAADGEALKHELIGRGNVRG